jgi:hypothetical protein
VYVNRKFCYRVLTFFSRALTLPSRESISDATLKLDWPS